MKTLLAITVAAAAIALAMPASALAGTTQILTAHHAGANFLSIDENGIATEVFIDASFDALQTLPRTGETEHASRFNIFIRQCDGICEKGGGNLIMTAMGRLENVNLIVAANLSAARLQATVPLEECEGACPSAVMVDLRWKATAPMTSMSASTHGPDEEWCIVADAVLHREAVAHGAVMTADGVNFTPSSSVEASLEKVAVHRISARDPGCVEEPPIDDV